MSYLELPKAKHPPLHNPQPYFHIEQTQTWNHGECGGSSLYKVPVISNDTANKIKPKYDLEKYFRAKTVCALNKIC